jgi:hypothetical protein
LTFTQYPYLYDNGSFTFYLDFYFRLSLRRLLPDLIVYRSNTADVLSESGTAYPSRAPQFIPGFFGEFHVAHLFIFVCCHIMCIYVRSSMLWCPLRFPHRKMFGSSLPQYEGAFSYLCYFCLFANNGVQHIVCFVSALFVFVLLHVSLDCPFLKVPSVLNNVYLWCSHLVSQVRLYRF